ncbi:protein ROOT PRIMORDIUM DEFECTIVE 1-like, partial [Trifolium medium]|nr:protein ROOT PRIMORDIUM DEFECTIVE 1-like [Trifolium medium]
MFSKRKIQTSFCNYLNNNFNLHIHTRSISSLKVVWRKDPLLDQAIEHDKRFKQCARVVKEVLNEPGQVIPLRYLEKRRERMRLK